MPGGRGAGGQLSGPLAAAGAHGAQSAAGTFLGRSRPLHGRVSLGVTGSCVPCSMCPSDSAENRSGCFCAPLFPSHMPPGRQVCCLFAASCRKRGANRPVCVKCADGSHIGGVTGKCLGSNRQAPVLHGGGAGGGDGTEDSPPPSPPHPGSPGVHGRSPWRREGAENTDQREAVTWLEQGERK